MENSDIQRIIHIKAHCEDVAELVARFGDDFGSFANHKAFFNAVTMSIMQIGELSNGLTSDFRDKSATRVPWALIRGTRNWIAHSYNQVDKDIVWEAANRDVPKLKEFCDEVLTQPSKECVRAENKPRNRGDER